MNKVVAVAQLALCFVFMFCNCGGLDTDKNKNKQLYIWDKETNALTKTEWRMIPKGGEYYLLDSSNLKKYTR